MSSRPGSAKHRRTLILCALSRFFTVFSTSRILAGAMKVSSSERRSSKCRSQKSIEFSSKNRTKIAEKSSLQPNQAKNASERPSTVLRDVPVAPPSGPAAPWERPGSPAGASRIVPGPSGSAPEASPELPGSDSNRPRSPRRCPQTVFSSIFGRSGDDFRSILR